MSTIAGAQKSAGTPEDGPESTGFRPTELTAAPTTPAVEQRRNWTRVLAGGLMVLMGGIGASLLFSQVDDSTQVLRLSDDITAGSAIEESDLNVLSLSSIDDASASTFTRDQLDEVVGQYAVSDIPQGSILTERMITGTPSPLQGSIVAMPISPSRLPVEGIHSGQQVRVVVGVSGGGQAGGESQSDSGVDMTPGRMWPAHVQAVGAPNDDGTITVNLRVTPGAAPDVAAAAASERLMVVVDANPNGDGDGDVISGEPEEPQGQTAPSPSGSASPSSEPSASSTSGASSSASPSSGTSASASPTSKGD